MGGITDLFHSDSVVFLVLVENNLGQIYEPQGVLGFDHIMPECTAEVDRNDERGKVYISTELSSNAATECNYQQ
ncbi:unnamed protein product [Sphenostylis stenocarpa]|uniref:Uncharacterized protein n=1 Tax=Sphenostylis stenocarpa TaxID=92480 RepID=A0AA87B9R1_9FABA|nr:unnamed protein product [Sphenostylis stenocarpa]